MFMKAPYAPRGLELSMFEYMFWLKLLLAGLDSRSWATHRDHATFSRPACSCTHAVTGMSPQKHKCIHKEVILMELAGKKACQPCSIIFTMWQTYSRNLLPDPDMWSPV